MSAGFDSAPVVAGGDGKCVDAVHDALVMGCCTIRVNRCDIVRRNDAISNCIGCKTSRLEIVGCIAHRRPGQRPVSEVGQDAQLDIAAAQLGNRGRHCFAQRIDEIGSHGIAGIDEKMHGDDLAAVTERQFSSLDVPNAATALDEPRMNFVCLSYQFMLCIEQSQ